MMYLEKALLHLVFLRATMLMIDKTFKGSKLICLLLAGLIGHTYIHLQSVRFASQPASPWASGLHHRISGSMTNLSSLVVPLNTIHTWLTIPSFGSTSKKKKKKEGTRDREQKRNKFCSPDKKEAEVLCAVPSWWYFTLNKQAEPHREREASIYPAPIIIHPLFSKFTFWHSIRTL